MNVGAVAGVVVAGPVLSVVIDRFGWRAAFGTVGVIGLVWAVVWARLGREGPDSGLTEGAEVRRCGGAEKAHDDGTGDGRGTGNGRAEFAVGRIAPAARRGVSLGALSFVFSLAGGLAPWTVGTVVDAAATPAAGYRDGYLLSAGLLVVAAVVSLVWLRPERDAVRLARH
ncbi:hypothetical protein [Streptomyces sp. NPDC047315]|uniref:hypothetical protein n=1 Tax=Streptomyces sp. NPDC047315 TaxID=3155142 RepID=UPI0033E6D40E